MEGDGDQGEGGRGALYKVAYEETVRALSEQQMAIDSLRSRAGLLLHRDLSLKMRSSYAEGWAALGTLSTFLQLASVLLVVEVVLWTIAITVVG